MIFTRARLGFLGIIGSATSAVLIQQAHAASSKPEEPAQPFSNRIPGVYVWGDNSQQLIGSAATFPSTVRIPTRLPLFDNQKLRDLAICSSFGLAALSNGDVVQFTGTTSTMKEAVVLKGKNVQKLLITPASNIALALTTNGSIFGWGSAESKPQQFKLPTDKLGWFEKFVDLECGKDHVVALTNKGRVFSGSLPSDLPEHHGQFGIARFSHFEDMPPAFELYQIKLLREPIAQIQCGLRHSLFLTKAHGLYGCGANSFGQLMLPFTFKNVKNSIPVLLDSGINKIAAGSGANLTYIRKWSAADSAMKWFVAGDGEYGQFGTGSFAQCQVQPVELKSLANMREYDEATHKVVPTIVDRLQIGSTHVYAQMDNPSGDWLMWGSNERGQLGNDKLSKIVKPIPVKSAPNFTGSDSYEFVVGDKVSACYIKA